MRKKLFLGFFLFIFLTTFYNPKNEVDAFFSLEEIEIQGVKNSDINRLKIKFNEIKNKNIIFIRKKDFEDIVKDFIFINKVEIKKIYPNKVNINIIENIPIGILLKESGERFLLLENNKIVRQDEYKESKLPIVTGEGSEEEFFNFHTSLKETNFNLKLIKQFNYYDINRWDLLLIDEKLIKLPSENYKDSILKFLEINEKSNFKKFKVFDFRLKNELIVK